MAWEVCLYWARQRIWDSVPTLQLRVTYGPGCVVSVAWDMHGVLSSLPCPLLFPASHCSCSLLDVGTLPGLQWHPAEWHFSARLTFGW